MLFNQLFTVLKFKSSLECYGGSLSVQEYDYLGARAIGMKPLLLRREYDNVPPESTQIIDSLLDILPLVKPE